MKLFMVYVTLDLCFRKISVRVLGAECMGGGVGVESVGTSQSQEVRCSNVRGDFIYHDIIDSSK